jgi:hypothetical protein
MPLRDVLGLPLAVSVLLLAGCDKPTTPANPEPDPSQSPPADLELHAAADQADLSGAGIPFAIAEVFFEFNTTDNDLGFQVFLDAEGWKRVRLLDPAEKEIALLQAGGQLARLGITELRFESAEPSAEEVLGRFPPGEYWFRGRTAEGRLLASNAVLSHDLLPAPTMSPSGAVVRVRDAVVEWNAPGAGLVEIIINHPELGHTFDVTLPASARRLKVPPQFLTPGQEYKIEILAISENGNRTIVESTFRTSS